MGALLATSALVVACGTNEENANNNTSGNMVSIEDVNLDPVDVEVMAPDTADVAEEVELSALVTQGDELVDDADEVTFEIWMEGAKSDSEMIDAELPGEEGVYAILHTFDEDGLYHVQPHTTARGMHVMPVHSIEVGDVEVASNEAENHDHNHEGEHNHDHEGEGNEDHDHAGEHSHDHGPLHESLALDWRVEETATSSTPVTLSIAVDWEDAAWENGRVRYEVWRNGDDMRQWLDVEEVEAGVYEVDHEFEEAGTYTVMVHLEDEEIHEHVAYEVGVTDE
ncbi:FixH family protein [Paenalkalicoccus suaedae]|uniref:FixH family protein n=2 Tax=Paenalkalicoccus suaedae TaxID=2592382 RepID=A0A859FCF7_9BACI|nr:FixH family protein [Paenalkalicoccus suaedae]